MLPRCSSNTTFTGRLFKPVFTQEARNKRNGGFIYPFGKSYGMTGIAFRIGDTVIGGTFTGTVNKENGILIIQGTFDFYLTDEFADPIDLGIEVVDLGETIFENIHRPIDDYVRGRVGLPSTGPRRLGVHTGEPYSITDAWSGALMGQIYADTSRSSYG